MASRKMTFTIPEELAVQFVRRVRPRDRSKYLTAVLTRGLAERDQQLIRACEVANQDPEVAVIESDFDALPSTITEPWNDAPAR
jgi:hypothetical protein